MPTIHNHHGTAGEIPPALSNEATSAPPNHRAREGLERVSVSYPIGTREAVMLDQSAGLGAARAGGRRRRPTLTARSPRA
jgi:hypothetical protein